MGAELDVSQNLYPYSIVWTPIHPITWLLPFVGHLGICDSKGIIHDWGGGSANLDCMMFGNPTRYLRLHVPQSDLEDSRIAPDWDRSVQGADNDFQRRIHCMICGSDCHSHVACALNMMQYGGFLWWNKVFLAAWIFFCGKHTSLAGFIKTWIGTVIMLTMYASIRLSSDDLK